MRCHLKQHSPAAPHPPTTSIISTSIPLPPDPPLLDQQQQKDDNDHDDNSSTELFLTTTSYQNMQNFCFQSTRPITINLQTTDETDENEGHQDTIQHHHNVVDNNNVQMASVISENPAASVLNAHHNQLYIVSPGGNSLQLIERDDFQFNPTLNQLN